MAFDLPQARVQAFILILIAFLAYFNTVFNDYALDDGIVILENAYTKSGFGGIGKLLTRDSFEGFLGRENTLLAGGRYRPLSLITFAIEYGVWGANPAASHLINALLFAVTVGLLFRLLATRLWPGNALAAFIACLLFALHPIHTEAVANIKGRDELLSLLFLILTWITAFDYVNRKNIQTLLLSLFYFLLALLSKENGLVLPAVLGLAFFTFLPKNISINTHIKNILPYIGLIGLYLLIRIGATGLRFGGGSEDVLNNPYIHVAFLDKIATIIYVFGFYLKLLIVPAPLSFDYSFNEIPYQSLAAPFVILSLLIHIGLKLGGIYLISKRNEIGFWIFFYLLSLVLVSNIFINVGAFLGERFLYQPSIAFCCLVALFITKLVKNKTIPAIALVLPILLAYGYKTLSRNAEWKSNETLYLTDVNAAPQSAKANKAAAEALIKTAREDDKKVALLIPRALAYLNKAVTIYPKYLDAYLDIGTAEYLLGNYTAAMDAWQKARALEPNNKILATNLGILADKQLEIGLKKAKEQNFTEAIDAFKYALKIKPQSAAAWYNMGLVYGAMPDLNASIEALEKAVALDGTQAEYYYNLGGAYYTAKNFPAAQNAWENVLKLDPNHTGARGGLAALKKR